MLVCRGCLIGFKVAGQFSESKKLEPPRCIMPVFPGKFAVLATLCRGDEKSSGFGFCVWQGV